MREPVLLPVVAALFVVAFSVADALLLLYFRLHRLGGGGLEAPRRGDGTAGGDGAIVRLAPGHGGGGEADRRPGPARVGQQCAGGDSRAARSFTREPEPGHRIGRQTG